MNEVTRYTTQEPMHSKQGNQRDITHYTPFVKRLLQRSQVILTGRGIALAGPMTWNPPMKRVTRGGDPWHAMPCPYLRSLLISRFAARHCVVVVLQVVRVVGRLH
jgi:hypothetical protein